MGDYSTLQHDLATADRHIAEGQARIAQQAKLVGELDADGHDTTSAQNLLRIMQRNLDVMNVHRQTIMRELAGAPDEQSWGGR